MLEPERTAALFDDARLLYDEAMELLDLGKLRVAAEVAWGATKRATDALIVARTGRETSGTGQTSNGIRLLSYGAIEMAALRSRFRIRARVLHAECFYGGSRASLDVAAALIRGTRDYIRRAENMAQAQP